MMTQNKDDKNYLLIFEKYDEGLIFGIYEKNSFSEKLALDVFIINENYKQLKKWFYSDDKQAFGIYKPKGCSCKEDEYIYIIKDDDNNKIIIKQQKMESGIEKQYIFSKEEFEEIFKRKYKYIE